MNPLLQAALGAFIRWGLAILAGYVVKEGIWSGGDATAYVEGATLGILALGWSVWQKYRARLVQVVTLNSPKGTSEAAVQAIVSSQTVTENVALAMTPKT